MRESKITRDEAFELLKKYNKDPFHIRHALTVEGVMRWYAKELGYADEEEYWGIVGLLHDIDFELYPEEHCKKAPELLKAGGVGDDMIYSICSHGYGICCDIAPEHEMEKVLYAVDELTGLIGAVCAKLLLDALRIRSSAVRGFALGTASHGIGAARALQVHPDAGAYAALALGLQVLLASLLLPLLARLS